MLRAMVVLLAFALLVDWGYAVHLRVGKCPYPPFILSHGKPGFQVELFDAIMAANGWQYSVVLEGDGDCSRFEKPSPQNPLVSGDVDVAIVPMQVTADLERELDFSHPFLTVGSILVTSPLETRWHFAVRRAMAVLIWPAVITTVLLVTATHLYWLAERGDPFHDKQRSPLHQAIANKGIENELADLHAHNVAVEVPERSSHSFDDEPMFSGPSSSAPVPGRPQVLNPKTLNPCTPEYPYWPGIFTSFYAMCVTFTTTGYGDIVPLTKRGRLLVIVFQLAVSTLAAYSSAGFFTALAAENVIGVNGFDDLAKVCVIDGSDAMAFLEQTQPALELVISPENGDLLPPCITSVIEGVVDGAVLPTPLALYWIRTLAAGSVRVVGGELDPYDLAFPFPANTTYRDAFSVGLLTVQRNGVFESLYRKYFGKGKGF